jgi:hypothetical protein
MALAARSSATSYAKRCDYRGGLEAHDELNAGILSITAYR